MGLKQGEIKVQGKWKNWDRRKARQQIYLAPGVNDEISKVGLMVSAEARQIASAAVSSKATSRADLAVVPSKVRFKDVRQWRTKRNTAVSKQGDTILVGLVVSDHYLSIVLEFGADTASGFISPSGFMRAAALKVAKGGYRFQPPRQARQDKARRAAETAGNRRAKRVSVRNRKNSRAGRKRR